MRNLTNKNIKFILLLLFIITIILTFSIYFAISFISDNQDLYNKDTYIPTSKRESYIIKNVDNILINNFSNYVSKNKNTLIVFWASWCQACVEESNDLNNFITNNPDIPVLVVSFDKNITDLETYLSSNNYNWFVFFDTERKIRKILDADTKGIPATYLINNNLEVITKEISSKTEDEFLEFYNLIT